MRRLGLVGDELPSSLEAFVDSQPRSGSPAYPTARLISAIGRRLIMCMLLIAATRDHLAGVWSHLGITGQSTLNRTRVFWSWAFGARVLAYGQLQSVHVYRWP